MMKTIHVCACVFFTAITGVAAKPARAQTQTPERVYTTTSAITDATGTGPSIINGFTASSGTLTTTSGTPYSERVGEGTALAADALGRSFSSPILQTIPSRCFKSIRAPAR
jgi:hypothetical protein